MKTFKICVVYQNWGWVEVEAEDLESAIEYAKDNIDELPLPDEPEYIDDSYEIDLESCYILN